MEGGIRFVTFEGIDGSGKSTQIEMLKSWLTEVGENPVFTREPGGSSFGPEIRDILLKERGEPLEPLAEVMLLMADRFQHVRRKILPAVDSGRLVVCDRFFDSTLAYQGGGRGLNLTWLERFYRETGINPHLTVYLDVSPETALKRVESRNRIETSNRLDCESLSFFVKVKNAYDRLIEHAPERFLKVNAEESEEAVQREIRGQLLRRKVVARRP